jgi:hypothetical protein
VFSLVRRLLTLLTVAAITFGLPVCANAHSATSETIFQAFTSDGTPTLHTESKSGYCWTGSLTADRDDAWRCFVSNGIYDPCFSSAQAPGVVVCPNAWLSGAVEIQLTKGLPRRYADNRPPSTHAQPWNVELTNRQHCTFASGATTVVEGQRLNYFCTGGLNYELWGYPIHLSEPWTIRIAPGNTKTLHGRRAILRVWT